MRPAEQARHGGRPEIEIEGSDWARRHDLVSGDLANWWQVTLDFLEIVMTAWPNLLAELDRSNPAAHRNALIRLEAERLRAFGEVARRVAHEMKNPLTPIRLAVAQMARRASPEFREELDVIAVESARLEAMAREFAELGRLPEGVAAPVDLGELLDDLLRSTVPATMTRTFRGAPDVATVVGYYDPLRRAFSNIVRNAVEACHGTGTIDVQLRQVDGRVEVAVCDNGPGIAPERREMIFQPYYTEKGDGTGLGLTIVRQTIEQHGGTIAVTETPGGGATFVVRLPAQGAEGRA